jgi:hypothetical protein
MQAPVQAQVQALMQVWTRSVTREHPSVSLS